MWTRDYEAEYYEECAKCEDFMIEASFEDERMRDEHDAAMAEMEYNLRNAAIEDFTDEEIKNEYARRFGHIL